MESNSDIRTQMIDLLSQWQQPWEGTPEEFYVFVFMMYSGTYQEVLEKDLSDPVNGMLRSHFETFAGGFMNIFAVDLSPYESFGDLIDNGNCDHLIREAAFKCKQTLEEICTLEEVTADGTIELSPETQKESALNDLITEIFMKRMQMFFSFKEQ